MDVITSTPLPGCKESPSVKRAKNYIHKRIIHSFDFDSLPRTFSMKNTPRLSISSTTSKSKTPSRRVSLIPSPTFGLYVPEITEPDYLTPNEALFEHSGILNLFEQKEIKRFKHIYYLRKTAKDPSIGFSNKEGDYLFEIGDSICYRYEILDLIDKGVFGQVLKCLDHKTNEEVAIKVLKKSQTSQRQGQTEYKIVQVLNADPQNNIIQVKRKFEFRFHFFMVFELVGMNLHDFLHLNEYRPLSYNLVKRIAIQVLTGIFHMHSLNIIHCDLKPENIAFKNSNKSSIRILDFGSSSFADTLMFNYIQSRFYRAPEVVLQFGKPGLPIDIWSLGCVIAELLLGEPIFKGKNEEKLVKSIVRVLGYPPEKIVQNSKVRHLLNNCFERGTTNLRTKVGKFGADVVSFLEGCLNWDPEQRITAEAALKLNWFKTGNSKASSSEY